LTSYTQLTVTSSSFRAPVAVRLCQWWCCRPP